MVNNKCGLLKRRTCKKTIYIMCVIIYKPKGIEMPGKEILAKINRLNHDGYGFVSTRHSFKTMYYGKFLNHLQRVNIDEDCIMHFRFATHGCKCRDNCHPFSEDGVYFAHNGILPITPAAGRTDSETVFRRIVYPAIARYGYHSSDVDNIINSIIGWSKFALMHKGEVRLFGEYKTIGGIYYSNLRWI